MCACLCACSCFCPSVVSSSSCTSVPVLIHQSNTFVHLFLFLYACFCPYTSVPVPVCPFRFLYICSIKHVPECLFQYICSYTRVPVQQFLHSCSSTHIPMSVTFEQNLNNLQNQAHKQNEQSVDPYEQIHTHTRSRETLLIRAQPLFQITFQLTEFASFSSCITRASQKCPHGKTVLHIQTNSSSANRNKVTFTL